MADSDIVCFGLATTPGIGQVTLTWAVTNPNVGGLPYLDLAAVEVWSATTNARGTATKAGEVGKGTLIFTHAGITGGTTLYYWIRARNVAGVYGDWYPLSATGGVSGTAGTSPTPGPGSIGTTELANGAVTNAKVTSVDASKISASSLSAITATLGSVTAGSISSSTITGTSITAGSFMTSGTARIDIPSGDGRLYSYDSGGSLCAVIGRGSGTSQPALSCAIYTSGARCVEFSNYYGISCYSASSTYSFYSGAGAYGPFTGAHSVLWPIDEPLLELGDLIADDFILFRNDLSNTLSVGKPAEKGEPALGVFVAHEKWNRPAAIPDDMSAEDFERLGDRYLLLVVNALGEGQINVCDAGGPIKKGALLVASSVTGKAEAQEDDLLRARTIARARETAVFDEHGRATVACIYVSG